MSDDPLTEKVRSARMSLTFFTKSTASLDGGPVKWPGRAVAIGWLSCASAVLLFSRTGDDWLIGKRKRSKDMSCLENKLLIYCVPYICAAFACAYVWMRSCANSKKHSYDSELNLTLDTWVLIAQSILCLFMLLYLHQPCQGYKQRIWKSGLCHWMFSSSVFLKWSFENGWQENLKEKI